MKIFISWSGELSLKVAELLHKWLEEVIQGCEAWVSSENIDKGAVWMETIRETLNGSHFGIICITRENKSAPWLLFEAGALFKGLLKSKVIPLCIDLTPTELTKPLDLFNATLPTKPELFKLVTACNSISESPLPEEKLKKQYDRCWEEFETPFHKILEEYKLSGDKAVKSPTVTLEDLDASLKSMLRSMEAEQIRSRRLEKELQLPRQLLESDYTRMLFANGVTKYLSEDGQIPAALPVSGKPGFVYSPSAPDRGHVDVVGIPSGTKVKCPYTGSLFLVP